MPILAATINIEHDHARRLTARDYLIENHIEKSES